MGKAVHKHALLVHRGGGLALALPLERDQTGPGQVPLRAQTPGTLMFLRLQDSGQHPQLCSDKLKNGFIAVEQTRGHEKLCCSNLKH